MKNYRSTAKFFATGGLCRRYFLGLKHDLSALNADLFRVNLINDPGCVCGWVIEDAIHFFLECCLYVRWDNAPQAHSRVSNINFDIWICVITQYII